jgi:hypothetical protein
MEITQIETVQFRAFGTCIRAHSPFKIEQLSSKIILKLYKESISSVMTYACPSRECTTGLHLVTLQCLEKKVSRTIENVPRRTLIRGFRVDFKLLPIFIITK